MNKRIRKKKDLLLKDTSAPVYVVIAYSGSESAYFAYRNPHNAARRISAIKSIREECGIVTHPSYEVSCREIKFSDKTDFEDWENFVGTFTKNYSWEHTTCDDDWVDALF